MRLIHSSFTVSFLWVCLFFPQAPPVFADLAAVFKAEDASDRTYYDQILTLIAGAKEAIDISMFAIQIQPQPEDPGYELVQALGRAAESGKRVRLWLNAKQASIGTNQILMRPDFQAGLLKKGIRIFYVDKSRRLHDKLIIVDHAVVVDGSMNWTREALLKNFESVSIIYSPELAAKKTARLESFPAQEQSSAGFSAALKEGTFSFPLKTLQDHALFPSAVEGKETRTLGLYILLLEQAHETGQNILVMDLEDWGERLPIRKKHWFGAGLRSEMRRALDFLKGYGLLNWEMKGGKGSKEAQVTLTPALPSGEQIQVPENLVRAGDVKVLSMRTLFVYLVARYKAQIAGTEPFWLGPVGDVAKEFYLSPVTLIRGLWDLRRENLLEIFPSEKKEVNGVWQREFTNRYLLNPVQTPEARERDFEALRKKFGDDLVAKARNYADAIDEPHDAEVTRQFVHLLKGYPEKDVDNAVRVVAGFNRNNALRTPAYVRGILAAEVK